MIINDNPYNFLNIIFKHLKISNYVYIFHSTLKINIFKNNTIHFKQLKNLKTIFLVSVFTISNLRVFVIKNR